jgi:maleylacetate reductase
VTPIIGQTENGLKTTQSTLKVLPEVVIYDVDLTMGLPLNMTVTSGFNAIAHAVEALYSVDNNPIIDQFARMGIESMVRALSKLKHNTQDPDARSDALFAAWACGTCLGQTSMSIHHKLCHVLGQ